MHAEDAGVERDGLAELGDRLVGAAQFPEDHAEVIVDRDRFGPELQGTPERFDRLVAPAHLLKGQAQGIEGVGIIRAELQRDAAAAGSPHSVAQVAERFAQVDMERGNARPQGSGPAEQLGRDGIFAPLGVLDAAGVQDGGRFGIGGVVFRDRVVHGGGLRDRQVPNSTQSSIK